MMDDYEEYFDMSEDNLDIPQEDDFDDPEECFVVIPDDATPLSRFMAVYRLYWGEVSSISGIDIPRLQEIANGATITDFERYRLQITGVSFEETGVTLHATQNATRCAQ